MLRTTLTKSYTLCGIGQGSWWRPQEIPSSRYWKKGRMLPIRECRTGLWWEALGSPQGLLKGTQVGIQARAPEGHGAGWPQHRVHMSENQARRSSQGEGGRTPCIFLFV